MIGLLLRCIKVGFDVVLESATVKIGRHVVELVHHPDHEPPNHIQFHGHIHEKGPNKLVNNQLNLSIEVWDYRPVAEKELIALLDRAVAPPPV